MLGIRLRCNYVLSSAIINLAAQQLEAEQEAFDQRYTEFQTKVLTERGYGEIAKDQQRLEALATFMEEIHPSLPSFIDQSPYLIELAEKARLYDAAQKSGKQRKLKGNSSKTLKGGAGGPKPKSKSSDPFLDQINDMFNS